jgi:hypothetical protein
MNFDAELSIKKESKKKIKINENGDFIEIDVDDNEFIEAFHKLEKDTQNLKAIDENFDLKKETEKICKELEKIFGKGVILKVFSVKNPSIFMILDFIMQIDALIEKFTVNKFQKHINRAQRRESLRR